MGHGAKLIEVVYADTEESAAVLIGIGDTIVASRWARDEVADPERPDLSEGLSAAELEFNRDEYRDAKLAAEEERENLAGLYAIFLGAERARLRGTELGWLEWLRMVTIPRSSGDDDAPAGDDRPGPGESSGLPSGA